MVHMVMLMTASFTSQEVMVVTTLTRVTSELTAATTGSLHYICACHIYTHSLSHSIFFSHLCILSDTHHSHNDQHT